MAKPKKTVFYDLLVISTVMVVATVFLLWLLTRQILQVQLYRERSLYLGMMSVISWHCLVLVFAYALVHNLPERMAGRAATAAIVVLEVAGFIGSAFLGEALHYPETVLFLGYLVVPFLFGTGVLVAHLIKKTRGSR